MFRKESLLQWIFFVVKPICKSRGPSAPLGAEKPVPRLPSLRHRIGVMTIHLSNSLYFIADHKSFLNMFVQSTN